MGDREKIVENERRDDRRPHAGVVVVAFGFAEDPAVGEVDGCSQTVGVERERRIHAVRPGLLGIFVRPADESHDRLDGEPGRNFTRSVAAHAIGNDEQAESLVDEERVFIRASYGAPIGAPSSA